MVSDWNEDVDGLLFILVWRDPLVSMFVFSFFAQHSYCSLMFFFLNWFFLACLYIRCSFLLYSLSCVCLHYIETITPLF